MSGIEKNLNETIHDLAKKVEKSENTLRFKGTKFSRIINNDDWTISTEFFQFIYELWGPHSVDRFASSNSAKTKLFNSLYWNPCALGVNSFNSDFHKR